MIGPTLLGGFALQPASAQSLNCTASFCGSDNATWSTGATAGGVATVQNNGVLNWALYANSDGAAGATGEDNDVEDGGTGGTGQAGGGATAINAGQINTGVLLNRSGLNALATGGVGGMGGTSDFGSDGNSGNGGAGGRANAINNAGAQINQNAVGAGIYAASDGGAGQANQSTTHPGNGGAGGTTNVTNNGSIITTPANADAIWATALGGAGGSGNPSSGAGNVGGTGGTGGTVNITNAGVVTTSGENSSGLAASAAGGAGGVGGSADLGDGSDGGHGGAGGTVNITNTSAGVITIAGEDAFGILALSTGGSGGGGGTGFDSSDGGAGGAGATAGVINITAAGRINMSGAFSSAIGAFGDGGFGSVGNGSGAGGVGGNGNVVTVNVTGVVSTTGASGTAVTLTSNGGQGGQAAENADGGAGGNGWAGTAVLGSSAGAIASITTTGASALGISVVAQGGQGGAGGLDNEDSSFTGFSGGTGGNGGVVYIGTWSNTLISTSGAAASAIYALSQGGAGGAGGPMEGSGTGGAGAAGGGANYVTVNLGAQSSILTTGDNAYGVFAESSGGDGGEGGSGGGGAYSAGGDGGVGGGPMTWNSANTNYQVSVTNYGTTLSTAGDYAFGVFAVANGGIGGEGGAAGSGAVSDGGSAGTGGNGGNILVQLNAGSITTLGYEAFGVAASSIGGGGGNGGSADGWCLALCVHEGGTGGLGGDGGLVTINNLSVITTGGTGSAGVFAVSVGGGGGNGGESSSDSVSVGPSVSIAIGGNGGPGGTGGAVAISNAGSILTAGMDAQGILAQSIGGGGGGGGQASANAFSVGADDIPAISLSVAVGGTAGSGGDGASVTVDNSGSIYTYDSQSTAIAAYSIGGGGGIGGNASASSYTYGTTPSVSIATAVGGNGGGGGHGGTVTIDNTGTLFTNGFAADAILAMSIGGGGGNGGLGTTVMSGSLPSSLGFLSDIPLDFGTSGGLTVGVGGQGAGGGNGGTVAVTNAGSITTYGTESRGIFAQSVGGGGGSGAAGQGSGSQTYSVHVSVGGSGADGGAGGSVTATNMAGGTIATRADGAHGIFAQSVGGGGGTGGTSTADSGDSFLDSTIGDETKDGIKYAVSYLVAFVKTLAQQKAEDPRWSPASVSVNVSVGGAGGAGGDGGAITTLNAGTISTQGDVAFGMFGQSIGGGGGAGGAATVAGGSVINAGVGIGGSGAIGGIGGAVTLTNAGTITTQGESAFGMLGQSVGGGGGTGALASDPQSFSLDFAPTIGGQNLSGSGLNGGAVSLVNSGTIATLGEEAHAMVVQSTGGGGGIFFMNAGDEADLTADAEIAALLTDLNSQLSAALSDEGVDTAALFADLQTQLNGASGMVQLALGASGTQTGFNDGGSASVTQNGAIATSGAGAMGILAQSIGGGGGFATDGGGSSVRMSLAASGNTVGGGLGNGGAVSVALGAQASISTVGTGAAGILAQSIGGGGGYAGQWDAIGFTYAALLAGTGSTMGVGNGGLVTITATADAATPGAVATIVTSGVGAHGIFAQSLNNGGVAVADILGLVIPDATGNTARSEIDASAIIALTADYLRDVAGQTVTSGVTIDFTGNISATGGNSIGIFAQSGTQGTSGAILASGGPLGPTGDIGITFTGTLIGGTDNGAGIVIDGGVNNTITLNAGSVVTALSETAIIASGGKVALQNAGTLIGGVDLSNAGTGSSFVNYGNLYVGGLTDNANYTLGTVILENNGVINAGGPQATVLASIDSGFTQSAGGTLSVDINTQSGVQTVDLLTVTSGSATLHGAIQFNPLQALLPGTYQFLAAAAGIVANAQITPSPLGVITWQVSDDQGNLLGSTSVVTPGALALSVTPQANFQPAGLSLTSSEQGVIQHIQNSWANGDTAMAAAFAQLANITTGAGYEAQLDSLSAEENNTPAANQTTGTKTSMNASLSCPAFSGTGTLMQETSCTWARVGAGRAEQSTTSTVNGYTVDSVTYRVGLQREVADDWFVGGTLGLTTSNMNPDNGLSSTDGRSGDMSLSLKHQIGAWLLSVTGHLGYGSYDTDRTILLGSNSWVAESSSDVWTMGGRVRAAYEFAFTDWYVKPYVDLDLIYTYMPGYTETGAGGLGLDVGSMNEWTFAFSPNIEVGARIDLENGAWMRPYASVGLTLLSNDSLEVETTLLGVGPEVPSYTTSLEVPDTLVDLGLGLQIYNLKGYELRAEYKAQVASDFLAQELSARLAIRF